MDKGMHHNVSEQQVSAAARYASRLAGRSANEPLLRYLADVDRVFEERTGVKYSEAYISLHGDTEALKRAFDFGDTPEDFANDTIRDFGLLASPEGWDRESLRAYNVVQVEICGAQIGIPNSGLRLIDGGVFYETDRGLASIRPHPLDGASRFGVAVRLHEGSFLDVNGRPSNLDEGMMLKVGRDVRDVVPFLHARELELEATTPGLR